VSILTTNNEVTVGRTIKRKLILPLLAGFLAFGVLIAAFGFNGTAFAVPLGGLGDFYVEFDELEGDGFKLLPQMGETGESDSEPLVRNEIDEVTIQGLHIYKDLPLPGTDKWVRFHVESGGETEISGLIQDAKLIDADLNFGDGLSIEQQNTEDFNENWQQHADSIEITDASIVTDYLFQEFVNLEDAKISTEIIDEPEMTDDGH